MNAYINKLESLEKMTHCLLEECKIDESLSQCNDLAYVENEHGESLHSQHRLIFSQQLKRIFLLVQKLCR